MSDRRLKRRFKNWKKFYKSERQLVNDEIPKNILTLNVSIRKLHEN